MRLQGNQLGSVTELLISEHILLAILFDILNFFPIFFI